MRGLRLLAVPVLLGSWLALAYRFAGSEWPEAAVAPVPPPAVAALTPRVLVLLMDGLRFDDASDPSLMPFLARMKEKGAYGLSLTGVVTLSPPGSRALMTGRLTRLSLEVSGGHFMRPEKDSLLLRCRAQGRRSCAIGSEDWSGLFGGHYTESLIQPFGGFARPDIDPRSLEHLRGLLRGTPPTLTVVELYDLDIEAHAAGASTPRYRRILREFDDRVRELWPLLERSGGTLLVTSHHAGDRQGRHGSGDWEMRATPYFLWGRGVARAGRRDLRQCDLAPALAALLGTGFPAYSEGTLDADLLDAGSAAKAELLAGNLRQKSALLEAYAAALGAPAGLPEDLRTAASSALERGDAERALPALAALLRACDERMGALSASKSLPTLVLAGAFLLAALLLQERFADLLAAPPRLWASPAGTAALAAAAALAALATRWSWHAVGASSCAAALLLLALLLAELHRRGAGFDRSDLLLLAGLALAAVLPFLAARPAPLLAALGGAAAAALAVSGAPSARRALPAVLAASALLWALVGWESPAARLLHRSPALAAAAGWGALFAVLALQGPREAPARRLALGAAAASLAAALLLPAGAFARAAVAALLAALALCAGPSRGRALGRPLAFAAGLVLMRLLLRPTSFLLLSSGLLLLAPCAAALGAAPVEERERPLGALLFAFSLSLFLLCGSALDFASLDLRAGMLGMEGYSLTWMAAVIGLENFLFFQLCRLCVLSRCPRTDPLRTATAGAPLFALSVLVQMGVLSHLGGYDPAVPSLPGTRSAVLGTMAFLSLLALLDLLGAALSREPASR